MGLRGCANDFPLIARHPQLHYLDTAASAQKSQSVIDAISGFYQNHYANVHRGSYELSQVATSLYEGSRARVAKFMGLQGDRQVIFTRGTTDGVNIVAQALAKQHESHPLRGGVMITRAEHHANFVPWQQLALKTKKEFLIAELSADLRSVDLDNYAKLIKAHRPALVALSSSSNVLGNRHPWREMAKLAKAEGAMVFLDVAQSVAHDPLDLSRDSELLDFVVFSAHKVFGPTGIGVLWAQESYLLEWEPTHFGGDMIAVVEDHKTTWNELPWKWEPGTPPIAEAVGFGAALDYLARFDYEEIHAYEQELCSAALAGFAGIEGLDIYGTLDAALRGPLVAFNLRGVHSLDLATWLDQRGVAVRSGHHCAQPLHRALGVESSLRASFSIYNDSDDVTALLDGVREAAVFFAKIRKKKDST